MVPGQQTEREITYKTGWKRSAIIISPKNPSIQKDQVQPGEPADATAEWSGIHRLNIAIFWRSAGMLPRMVLLVILWVFPVLTFMLSLWLVHLITIQSQ